MFRKKPKTPDLSPLDVSALPEDSTPRRVVETIKALNLDPRLVMVVGSAALTLYGIEPPVTDETSAPRPGDVDLVVPPFVFSDLYRDGAAPSGVPLTIKNQYVGRETILTTGEQSNPNHLPVDVITRARGSSNPTREQAKFEKHLDKHALPIPGGDGLRVISPDALEAELRDRANDGTLGMIATDESALSDLAAIRKARNLARQDK